MILRTVEQARRVLLIIAGFTLLLAGGVMLVAHQEIAALRSPGNKDDLLPQAN
jgi:hypothetical protein